MVGVTPEHRQIFAQAVFRGEPFPADWPSAFAIITAHDPEGRPASPADNISADAALELELRAAGRRLHRVTGGSADGLHQEPGWAVPLGLAEAGDLGRRYRQVAVFFVRDGSLQLVACEDGTTLDLGRPFGLT